MTVGAGTDVGAEKTDEVRTPVPMAEVELDNCLSSKTAAATAGPDATASSETSTEILIMSISF